MSADKKTIELEPFSIFDEPLVFDSIVFHEVPEQEGGFEVPSIDPKPTYVDLTDGEFFKYRAKAKD